MPLRKSDYENAMKIHYFGPIKDQLENSTALLSRMERYEQETGGVHLQLPTRTGRTTSIGARGDTGITGQTLPAGDRPTYSVATFTVKPQYLTIRVTGFAMRSARNPTFAFARAQTRDMEDSVKDFKKDINRQLFGDGSGRLAKPVTGDSTVVVFTSDLYPTRPTHFMYARELLDFLIVTTGLIAEVTAGSIGNAVVTVDSATQATMTTIVDLVSTTDAPYRQDNVTGTDIKEMYGLDAVIDDSNPDAIHTSPAPVTGDFGNIDRATVTSWQAQMLSNSGTLRAFSVNLVEQGIDKPEENAGGEVSLLQTNYAIFRIYGALLAAAKTADMAKMDLDGGFKALSVNGVPMVRDVDSPDYRIFCIDESTFYLGVTGDWAWLEDDGGGILSRISQEDLYEAVLNRDMQLMCDKPSASCKIEDVSHS